MQADPCACTALCSQVHDLLAASWLQIRPQLNHPPLSADDSNEPCSIGSETPSTADGIAGAAASPNTAVEAEDAKSQAQLALILTDALQQQRSLLALRQLSAGRTAAADQLLRQLRCRWRLSDSVWAAASGSGGGGNAADGSGEQPADVTPAASTGTATSAGFAGAHRVGRDRDAAPAAGGHSCSGSCAAVAGSKPVWLFPAGTAVGELLDATALAALQRGFRSPFATFWQAHRYFEPSSPYFSYAFRLDAPPANGVERAILRLRDGLLAHPQLSGESCAR